MRTELPFPRSLTWTILVSYAVVIMVTVGTTFISHTAPGRDRFRQDVLTAVNERAQTVAHEMSQCLQSGAPSSQMQHRLLVLDQRPPRFPANLQISIVDIDQPLGLDLDTGAIHLEPRQIQQLRAGQPVLEEIFQHQRPRGAYAAQAIWGSGGGLAAAAVAYMVLPPMGDFEHRVALSLVRSILLALVIASVAALLLARYVTTPIRRLEKVAGRFAQGDFSARAQLSRSDEIGVLAGAFDDMAARLEQTQQTRCRLLCDVSHELSTPITTIRATVEAILDGVFVDDQEKEHYLQSVLSQVEHLSYLVDDLTELSRFETGNISIHPEVFGAREPLDAAVGPARLLAAKKGTEIRVRPCAVQVEAVGDPRRIMQALKNLVGNAIAHNPPGTHVEVACQVEGERVVYSVADDGISIPKDELESIFERFYLSNAPGSDRSSGCGLGLAIVREIVRAHGSTVSVTCLERGKRFSFWLPLAAMPLN